MGKGTGHVPTSTNMVMNPSQNGSTKSSIKFLASYFCNLCLKISKESKQLVSAMSKKNRILRTMNRFSTKRSRIPGLQFAKRLSACSKSNLGTCPSHGFVKMAGPTTVGCWWTRKSVAVTAWVQTKNKLVENTASGTSLWFHLDLKICLISLISLIPSPC